MAENSRRALALCRDDRGGGRRRAVSVTSFLLFACGTGRRAVSGPQGVSDRRGRAWSLSRAARAFSCATIVSCQSCSVRAAWSRATGGGVPSCAAICAHDMPAVRASVTALARRSSVCSPLATAAWLSESTGRSSLARWMGAHCLIHPRVSGASVRRPVNDPSAVTKPDSHVYGKRGPGDRLARNRTCRGLGNR